MSDRTCGNCGTIFDYPYLLERHINNKRKCKLKSDHENNICQYCNFNYCSKYSLSDHQVKCKKNPSNNNNNKSELKSKNIQADQNINKQNKMIHMV